jgi:hypothetical protein
MTRGKRDDELEARTTDPEPDPELARLLKEWTVPAIPDSLDERVTALYRSRVPRPPLWRRLVRAEIRIPLPVAVALIAALLLAVWAPWKQPPPMEAGGSDGSPRAVRLERPSPTATGARGPSLAGFEPVSEMNVTLIPQGGTP